MDTVILVFCWKSWTQSISHSHRYCMSMHDSIKTACMAETRSSMSFGMDFLWGMDWVHLIGSSGPNRFSSMSFSMDFLWEMDWVHLIGSSGPNPKSIFMNLWIIFLYNNRHEHCTMQNSNYDKVIECHSSIFGMDFYESLNSFFFFFFLFLYINRHEKIVVINTKSWTLVSLSFCQNRN